MIAVADRAPARNDDLNKLFDESKAKKDKPATELPFLPPDDDVPRSRSGVVGVVVQPSDPEAPQLIVPASDYEFLSDKRPEPPLAKEHFLLAHQNMISVGRDEHGNLVLKQDRWPDDSEDATILIHRDYEQQFLDNLCDFLGIGSVGRS
jgi:hypothetical protein